VLLVSLADKLFNARAILRDHGSVGESVWERFTAGRDEQLWYYRSLSDSFTHLMPHIRMTSELEEAVERLELLCRQRPADALKAAPGSER
jgi:GTP pyrophosphokinase